MKRSVEIFGILAIAVLVGSAPMCAAAQAVHKTTLQDIDYPPPGLHSVLVRTIVNVGGAVAPHTHPGLELCFIESGSAMLTIKGRVARTLSAGESFSVPPDTVHSVQNTGQKPLVMVSTYVVSKDRPIAVPLH
jgi:quercetin dioxygenase-like cupin family protein